MHGEELTAAAGAATGDAGVGADAGGRPRRQRAQDPMAVP